MMALNNALNWKVILHSFWTIWLIMLLMILLSSVSFINALNVIHIGITLDENSARDALLLAKSVVSSAYFPQEIEFHVVVCGRNTTSAQLLLHVVKDSFTNCLPKIKAEFKEFVLPATSGFALQRDSVTRRSHWYSPTGADMARFFLPSLFPHIEKILYLDNDIIVSCCIEEVYRTELKENHVVGIALDDLKWATITQFRRQYNASHPLVIENIRRPAIQASQTATIKAKSHGEISDVSPFLLDPISEDEFWKALPRYPNDGVLLINIPRYNSLGILESAEKIALANARGDYVVGLGTQQFTVLLLHERWIELTPRANLRHFPDMARGYLMWFLYNGVIHYAGMAKPRAVCAAGSSDNEHRIGTYTPWVTTVYRLNQQCPSTPLLADSRHCANHVMPPTSWINFRDLVKKLGTIKSSSHSDALVLHFGSVRDSTFTEPYVNDKGVGKEPKWSIFDEFLSFLLLRSPWSIKFFDADHVRASTTTDLVRRGMTTVSSSGISLELPIETQIGLIPTKNRRLFAGGKANKLASKSWTDKAHAAGQRKYSIKELNFCDGSNNYESVDTTLIRAQGLCSRDSFVNTYEQNQKVNAYQSKESCVSILQYIKDVGHKHWDVIGMTIDYQPTPVRPWQSSLGVLRNIDLVFMRPKFVVVRVGSPRLHVDAIAQAPKSGSPQQITSRFPECQSLRGSRSLDDDVEEVMAILRRSGFEVSVDTNQRCGQSPLSTSGGLAVRDADFVCVWGTRTTTIDLGISV